MIQNRVAHGRLATSFKLDEANNGIMYGPGKEQPYEEMKVDAVLEVEGGKGMGSRIFIRSVVWTEVPFFGIGDSRRKLGPRSIR